MHADITILQQTNFLVNGQAWAVPPSFFATLQLTTFQIDDLSCTLTIKLNFGQLQHYLTLSDPRGRVLFAQPSKVNWLPFFYGWAFQIQYLIVFKVEVVDIAY